MTHARTACQCWLGTGSDDPMRCGLNSCHYHLGRPYGVIEHGFETPSLRNRSQAWRDTGLNSNPSGLAPPVCGVIASDVVNALSTTAAPLFRGTGTWHVFPILS